MSAGPDRGEGTREYWRERCVRAEQRMDQMERELRRVRLEKRLSCGDLGRMGMKEEVGLLWQ